MTRNESSGGPAADSGDSGGFRKSSLNRGERKGWCERLGLCQLALANETPRVRSGRTASGSLGDTRYRIPNLGGETSEGLVGESTHTRSTEYDLPGMGIPALDVIGPR